MEIHWIPYEKNSRKKIWTSMVIGLILLASVCRMIIRLMEDIPTIEDIYFQAYDNQTRACLKNHSRHLHAPLCVIFALNSVDVARYASFI